MLQQTSALGSSDNAQSDLRSKHEPSLKWLISPVTKDEYFKQHWEARPLVVKRDQPDYFSSLLSFEEVDRVITALDRRYPDICLKNAARPIAPAEYTLPGGILDVARVCQLFQEGSTITLAYLDTIIPALTRFCRALETEFSCPLQTNVYLTPAGAQGAQRHYDTHDVFVLQVAGAKKWTIFGTPIESPLAGQDYDDRLHDLGDPTLEFELKAGDVAYIPRGVGHEARCTDTTSLHITAGVLRYTWADLLLEVVSRASLNDPEFRKALPPGLTQPNFEKARAYETLLGLLRRAGTVSNFDAALDSIAETFFDACPPSLEGQMTQLAALDRLRIDSVVGARQGVVFRLQTDGESDSVEYCSRKITFPPHAREALRFALRHSRFAVRSLPGNLDDAGKLVLVRRLIREGLLVSFSV